MKKNISISSNPKIFQYSNQQNCSKTILITGATGYLGSNLVKTFLNDGYFVIGIKRETSSLIHLKDVLNNSNLLLENSDYANLKNIFSNNKIDIVIHTACCYGRNNETLSQIAQANILFGLYIFELCTFFNIDTFFNTDTLLQPYLNNYRHSKKHFSQWLKQNSTNKIHVFNMKWIFSQFKQNKKEILLTQGLQKRDFIYIDDVVNAYKTVLKQKNNFYGFNEFDVGTGKKITIKDFVKQIQLQYKIKYPKNNTNLIFGAIPYRSGEMMDIKEDITQLLNLGWEPKIFYKEGIKKILEIEGK